MDAPLEHGPWLPRVVRCGHCGAYMAHGCREAVVAPETVDACRLEQLTVGILWCQHCPDEPPEWPERFVYAGNVSYTAPGAVLRVTLP